MLLQLPLLAVLGTVHDQHQLVRCCDVADVGQDAGLCSRAAPCTAGRPSITPVADS